MTTTLAEVKREFPAPNGYEGKLRVTAKAYQLNGNSHPHFSVTGEIGTTRQFETGNIQACGCLHDDIAKAWPAIKPVITLHLSNADDGAPMHAEANGFYWLAGVVGGLGEQYHGGSGTSGKSPDECLRILSEHMRISLDDARTISGQVRDEYRDHATQGIKAANTAARNRFHDFVLAQRDRWEAEAKAGIALIKELATS